MQSTFMPSLPRPSSLIFDLDLELDDSYYTKAGLNSGDADLQRVLTELREFLDCHLAATQLAQDIRHAILQLQHAPQEPMAALARALSLQGYSVMLRHAVGGGDGFSCLRNLRNVFLSVCCPGTDTSFIVDLSFADSFRIAKPTPRYSAILACLDERPLVIPEDHISLLVNFLCAEVAAAFKETDIMLPPWRIASSMLSKWQPRKSKDEAVHEVLDDDESPQRFCPSKAATGAWSTCHVAVGLQPIRVCGGFSGCAA